MSAGFHRVVHGLSRFECEPDGRGRTSIAGLLAALLALSCEDSRPAPSNSTPYASGEAESSGLDLDAGSSSKPPSLDAPGLCGNQLIGQVVKRPNVYFILDRSGSMADEPEGDGHTKYDSVLIALRDVLQQVGHRVRYGAAVFPASSGSTECAPGVEVLETSDGDPVAYALQGELGPVLLDLLTRLGRVGTEGSTPTAATLAALAPTVLGLEGETVVILATDGEPNCGEFDYCEPSDCSLVQSSYVLENGMVCSETVNCCDPEVVVNGPEFCVDDLSAAERLRELAKDGIRTYVIGLPGSEASANILNALARAGADVAPESAGSDGGATDSPDEDPYYYPVEDTESLASALKEITTSVAIECEIELVAAPPVPSQVNLYFDGVLIPADPVDGWELTGELSVEIKGEACARLRNGDVYQVQIAAGCPTVVL